MVHEDYKEMLPALALSALDAEDARALNQHLSECDECRRELAGWESTAAALALNAAPAEPSPQVRDRITSAVRSDKQTPPRQESTQSRVVEFSKSRRAAWTSFGQVGAVAAAVLCLVLILWIIVLWQQNRALRRDMDQLENLYRALEEDAGRANEFVAILTSPGAKVAPLKGSGPGTGASAQLAYDTSGRAMLMANGLPPTPAGKEYQLWFIVGNRPIPGGTFATDEVGRGELTDHVPDQALDLAVFAVTLEPAGGTNSPTGSIYLRSGL
jgi:anti-sigma-K factor RskA